MKIILFFYTFWFFFSFFSPSTSVWFYKLLKRTKLIEKEMYWMGILCVDVNWFVFFVFFLLNLVCVVNGRTEHAKRHNSILFVHVDF